jgi:hypothetical protein
MLTAATLVWLFGGATLLACGLARVVDGLDRRRLSRVAAEISVTEAVHGVLGPVVAPTVSRHHGRPWTVTFGLAPRDLAIAGRLAEIAGEALGRRGTGVRIVFVPRPGR